MLIVEHMGALHPLETVLVFLIAFGPFVVLGFVIYRLRQRDLAQEHALGQGEQHPDSGQESAVSREPGGSDLGLGDQERLQ